MSLLREFKTYIERWDALQREYESVLPIPIYQDIKQISILRKMSKLNRDYEERVLKNFPGTPSP